MSKLVRREQGTLVITDPESDTPLLEQRTVQCVHCGGHYWPSPGSGRIRGYCTRCAGPVCGPGCAACVPIEQLLENFEKGNPLEYRPIVVSVSLPD